MYNSKAFALLAFLIICLSKSNAQTNLPVVKKDIVFSAVKGTLSKPASIILPSTGRSVVLNGNDSNYFRFLSNTKNKIVLLFTPS
ncbi:MAG: hypothetical protein ABI480_19120, partial [Chitinophagaceae bacterium]